VGKNIYIVTGLVIATAVAVLSSGTTHAADTEAIESITLSPVSRQYKVDAGGRIEDKLTIVNDGKVGYDFIVYSRPYSVKNEAYEPDFTKITMNTDAYQWVRLTQTKYRIEAGATVEVPYAIQVPATATPGGHYGVIFAETQPPEGVSASAVIRKKRVGSIIYATVNGNYTVKGEVAGADIPFLQVEPPLVASATVRNTGNTDFKDSVRMTVKDIFGNVKYDANKEYPVLPQTTRKIALEWQDAPWFGLYSVDVSQKFLDKNTTSSGYVLLMPRLLPFVALGILLVGGGYALYRRNKK
jgi:hypothetical protein